MKFPSRIFIDTSYLIALLNSNDTDHARATKFQAQLSTQKAHKITSEYVLMELGDGLSRLRFRPLAQKMLELIHADNTFEIIPSSTVLFNQARALFNQRPDKEWGMTDCSSFIIMQNFGLHAALTADQHFEQAGFQALLRIDED